jgi:Lipocalin-like domain
VKQDMESGFAKASMPLATGPDLQRMVLAKFVGTWTLVTLGGEGVLVERLGVNPLGILIYDRSQNMSVQIMNRDHGTKVLNSNEDIKHAFQSYVGYFGKYSINLEEQSITHHVSGSLYPGDIGRDFKRLYQFSGNHLILTADGLIGGDPIAAHLVWERAAF